MKINMRNFIETGHFGDIKLGMSRDEVGEILGEPPMWGSGNDINTAAIWRYGSIEFYFAKQNDYDNALWMIFTDNLPLIEHSNLEIDAWIIKPDSSLSEVETILNSEEITYTKHQLDEHLLTVTELHFLSGVVLTFNPSLQAKITTLTSISLKRKIQQPETKQVAVSIPQHLYEKLQTIAKKRKESIAKIAGEILIDYLEQMADDE